MKKKALSIIMAFMFILLAISGCGKAKSEEIPLNKITSIKGDTLTIGNKEYKLSDVILVSGSPSELKKGDEAYIIKSNDKKYLITYSKDIESKTNDGIDVYGKIKSIDKNGITLMNGHKYQFADNVVEQTSADDFKTIKKFNINDFASAHIVRFLVKDNKIVTIIKY